MAARFIHIGDAHLGPNARNTDRRAAIDQIIAQEIIQPVSAWLWPGDLNHGRMTIEDRNWFVGRISRMADTAPVVICYGNHDLPGDLDFLARLNTVWPIYVISTPQVIEVPLASPPGTLIDERAAIFVLPYPTKAGLVALGIVHDQLLDEARAALMSIFLSAAAELQQKTAEGCIPLMIGHVNVAGSVASVGQPNIGKEIEIDQELLNRLGPIYKGLNHIHKGQTIGGAVYPGSICRLDWGEIEPKCYVVVEYADAGSFQWWPRTLDVAPMYHVEGELTRDGFTWRVTKGLDGPTDTPPESFDGAEVRVRFRYSAAEKSALDEALVRAPFEGAKRVDTDPIAMRSRAVRAPEVAAAATLDAKTQVFVQQSGVEWTPSFASKLALLQQVHADDQAFLAAVRQGLSGVVPDGPAAGQDQESTCADSQAVPDTELQEAL